MELELNSLIYTTRLQIFIEWVSVFVVLQAVSFNDSLFRTRLSAMRINLCLVPPLTLLMRLAGLQLVGYVAPSFEVVNSSPWAVPPFLRLRLLEEVSLA
jgi:hypothetical protein